MDKKELIQAIKDGKAKELDLTNADFLDYNPRQIARWESGESVIPVSIIAALKEIAKRKIIIINP